MLFAFLKADMFQKQQKKLFTIEMEEVANVAGVLKI
jgi:hypothetical protein